MTGAPVPHSALAYVGDRTLQVQDRPDTAPGPLQVRVDVAYTGICGTDLHILHGDMDARVTRPAVLGHEMSGRVAEIGAGVSGWAVGDPVTVMPLDWCGSCPACLAGHSHVCQRLTFLGIDAPGSLQRSWVVPERTLLRLPDGLDLRDAALIEPTAVALHDLAMAGPVQGARVLVVGAGPIGLLVAWIARSRGAHLRLVEIDPARRAVARALGLQALDPLTEDVAGHLEEWTGSAGVDLAFEVSGAQAGVDLAVDQLKVRGRLVVIAIHPTPRPVNLQRVFWRELTLLGTRLYERGDFAAAVDLVAAGAIPVEQLVTTVVPLADAAQAFDLLASGGGVVKVLVDCGGGRT